jgi:hypothetical protein
VTTKQKIEGVIHLTYYLVHPFMLTSFMLCVFGAMFQLRTVGMPVPSLQLPQNTSYTLNDMLRALITQVANIPLQWFLIYLGSVICALGSWAFYAVVLIRQHLPFREQVKTLLTLTLLGFGISINNSISVFMGLFNPRSGEFMRTPKYAIEHDSDTWKGKKYQIPFNSGNMLEALGVFFGIFSTIVALLTNNLGVIPILVWFTASYAAVGLLTLVQSERVTKVVTNVQ